MTTFLMSLVPALWLAWLAYWIYAAMGAKETRRYEPAASRITHGVAAVTGALLLSVPSILGHALEGRFHPQTFAWFATGAAMVAVGLAFAVAARVWLGANWSGSVTLKQNHELIRSGPYALARHPIYTGLLLALIGTAIVVGRWRALVALALLLASVLYKIRIEERFMKEEFGDEYARYRAEVKALVPFVV